MPDYRRRLPHIHPNAAHLFLTWRLWGSLPAKRDIKFYPTPVHAFLAQDRILDRASTGPRWLEDPHIAGLLSKAILDGECQRHFYQLEAWVVMPNHVHLLILPQAPVPELMQWLKASTARAANRLLARTHEPFWQDESYDHYLRNPGQISRTIRYIEQNPVTAGLTSSPDTWLWSSAGQADMPAPQ